MPHPYVVIVNDDDLTKLPENVWAHASLIVNLKTEKILKNHLDGVLGEDFEWPERMHKLLDPTGEGI